MNSWAPPTPRFRAAPLFLHSSPLTPDTHMNHSDSEGMAGKLEGVLLGTALGDALALPAEGLSARVVARRFGRLERFRLFGRTGYVSDDTEQSALVAECLLRFPEQPDPCAAAFRRRLAAWIARLPWGVGRATLTAGVRCLLRFPRTGVQSAGNGAAMRAVIIGAFFCDHAERRRAFGEALAETTHRDPRAIAGALFVAEVAAACTRSGANPSTAFAAARATVSEPSLAAALDRAEALAWKAAAPLAAAEQLGVSGFVLHTIPFATYAFLRHQGDVLTTLADASAVGGDTDSIGAILGGWLGALHGAGVLPHALVDRLHDGPFGPTHLRALAAALAAARRGETPSLPRYSALAALVRNLALYPVVLAHGFRRLLPPY